MGHKYGPTGVKATAAVGDNVGGGPVQYIPIFPQGLWCDGSGAVTGDIGGVWIWTKGPKADMSVLGPPGHGGESKQVLWCPL